MLGVESVVGLVLVVVAVEVVVANLADKQKWAVLQAWRERTRAHERRTDRSLSWFAGVCAFGVVGIEAAAAAAVAVFALVG